MEIPNVMNRKTGYFDLVLFKAFSNKIQNIKVDTIFVDKLSRQTKNPPKMRFERRPRQARRAVGAVTEQEW